MSEQTLRRWLSDAADRELNRVGIRRATQLAILCSKGHLLWPDLGTSSRARAAQVEAQANARVSVEHAVALQELAAPADGGDAELEALVD